MKKVFLALILACLFFQVSAQTKSQKVIKVYSDFKYLKYGSSLLNKSFSVHPAFSFAFISENKNFHELEFPTFISARSKQYQWDLKHTSFSARYSYNLRLMKSKNWTIVPILGFSASPYFQSEKYQPLYSNAYPLKINEGGIALGIIPRINWNLSEDFYLDVNIPIRLASLGLRYSKVYNPTIPEQQQEQGAFEFDTFSHVVEFQIGLGFRL